MAILLHRCNACGHDKRWHEHPDHTPGPCTSCRCAILGDFGPPEVAPTFTLSGLPVETLHPPGSSLFGYGHTPTCSCADCGAEYRSRTHNAKAGSAGGA